MCQGHIWLEHGSSRILTWTSLVLSEVLQVGPHSSVTGFSFLACGETDGTEGTQTSLMAS
jgi:hypothetical protein